MTGRHEYTWVVTVDGTLPKVSPLLRLGSLYSLCTCDQTTVLQPKWKMGELARAIVNVVLLVKLM